MNSLETERKKERKKHDQSVKERKSTSEVVSGNRNW